MIMSPHPTLFTQTTITLSLLLPFTCSTTMLDLKQGLARNHVHSSDIISRINDSFDSSRVTDFGPWDRRTAQKYENYDDQSEGGIEFRARTEGEDGSGPSSPPLWKTSPSTSPKNKASLLQQQQHHSCYLSPMSRIQAIARGRRELMEMVQNMPESSYELSLKDLVEHQTMQGVQQETIEESDMNNRSKIQSEKRKKSKKNDKERQIMRSGSMDNGAFLLKIFFPISLGLNKSSTMDNCSKISPRPLLLEGPQKGVDKGWWKKWFSVACNSNNSGTSSIDGSSVSSNSSRSRRMGGCLPGCLSFFQTKKSITR